MSYRTLWIMREKLQSIVSFLRLLFTIIASMGLQPWAMRLDAEPETPNEDVDLLVDMFLLQDEDRIHRDR